MKFILLCIVVYIQVCSAFYSRTIKNGLRIRGGRNATEYEFPYVVKIILQSLTTPIPDNTFICTGVVLSSKWTLTAGHCFTFIEENVSGLPNSGMIQTKAVVEYQPSPKAEFAYSEIISTSLPPNFHKETSLSSETGTRYDIGLLQTQPVLFAKYGKLSPIDYAALSGQMVSIVGYGMMNMKDELPSVPQVLDAIVLNCPAEYDVPQMCFAPSCDVRGVVFRAICPGDSGGLAVHASGVVSVSSISDDRDCGMKISAAVSRRDRYEVGYNVGSATPVSPFVDWISTVMRTDISL